MTSSSARKHAGPGPATDLPPVPDPTFAERAHTLVYLARMGSLSTLSRKQPGFPFGSVMPYGLDDHGRPIFLSAPWPCTRKTCKLIRMPVCSSRSRTPMANHLEHRGERC